jgi:hypothetical protein
METQYRRFNQWIDEFSPTKRILAGAALLAILWAFLHFLVLGSALWYSLFLGGVGGFVCAGLRYWWAR